MAVTRGWEWRNGEMFVKGHTLAVIGRVSPGDLKHSIAFTVNNIIIYIKVAKKLDLKVLTTKKE